MMKKFLRLMIFCSIVLFSKQLEACSCGRPFNSPITQEDIRFLEKSLLFTGQVTQVSLLDGNTLKVKVAVDQVFNGEPFQELEVQTNLGEAACGYPFQVGFIYLIDAYKSDQGALQVNICGFTKMIHQAREDIKILESNFRN